MESMWAALLVDWLVEQKVEQRDDWKVDDLVDSKASCLVVLLAVLSVAWSAGLKVGKLAKLLVVQREVRSVDCLEILLAVKKVEC